MERTNLSKQTKYYLQQFNKDKHFYELVEIELGRNTWWYVQVDATIRYVFAKFNVQIPKYVIIQEVPHYITFKIVREDINTIEELQDWNNKLPYIKYELKLQAEANSSDSDDDHWVKYKFELV